MMRRALSLLLLAMALPVALPALAVERVTVPGPGGLALPAAIYRPSGIGPFPAVVALHGCGGLDGRDGEPSARHADWGERLAAAGFVALFPDSFKARGAKSQCRTRDRVTRPSRERKADAIAAGEWLARQPDVKADAVNLLGWSNGGSTALYTARVKGPFQRVVAFYPGCRIPAKRGDYAAAVPVLILIGEADDWTAAAPCEDLARQAQGHGAPITLKTYPGAYHDFDHPHLRLRERSAAYSSSGTGRVHAGTDPVARADAIPRAMAFFAR